MNSYGASLGISRDQEASPPQGSLWVGSSSSCGGFEMLHWLLATPHDKDWSVKTGKQLIRQSWLGIKKGPAISFLGVDRDIISVWLCVFFASEFPPASGETHSE